MATKSIKRLEAEARELLAQGRALKKRAKIRRARQPMKGNHGGAREGAGRLPRGETRRVQESFQLLPDTIEALESWAKTYSTAQGRKVSPRVLVEAATRWALDLPLSPEELAVLGVEADESEEILAPPAPLTEESPAL